MTSAGFRHASPEDECLDKAWELARTGDFSSAIRHLEKRAGLGENDRVYASLAHFHYMLTAYTSAQSYAEKSLDLNPNNRMALVTLGDIFYRSGSLDKAEGYFAEAFRLNPGDVYPAIRLGIILLRELQYDAAVQVLEKAREHHSENLEILEQLELACMGAGDHTGAMKIHKIIQEKSGAGQEFETRNLITKLERMDPEKAVEQLQIILQLPSFDDKIPFHDLLARLYIQLERFQEAIPHLEIMVKHRPRSDALKVRIANCLTRSGKPGEALETLSAIDHMKTHQNYILAKVEALAGAGFGQEALDLAIRALLVHTRNRRLRKLVKILQKKGLSPTPGILEEKPDPTP